MTSPNVQIQTLMRRYIKERDGAIVFNKIIENMLTPPKSGAIQDPPDNMLNLSFATYIQTCHIYNFRDEFNYRIFGVSKLSNPTESELEYSAQSSSEELFDMELESKAESYLHSSDNIRECEQKRETTFNRDKTHIGANEPVAPELLYEIRQYLGKDGMLNNVYGAELVDERWVLYAFIISKINRTFKRNMLADSIRINSLHFGNCASTVVALHHVFNASDSYKDTPVKWQWLCLNRNELYSEYRQNFIPHLSIRPYWEQVVFILNKIGEYSDKYNLFIHHLDPESDEKTLRNQYLFIIIVVLKYIEPQGVFLLEIPQESEWKTLEINIVALCGLIFNEVYVTKYSIETIHTVLVCSDKKKNINTSTLVKKLVKVLLESDTICIIALDILSKGWINNVWMLQATPVEPLGFMQIINGVSGVLLYNEEPFIRS